MSEGCNHDCNNCQSTSCSSRENQIPKCTPNRYSKIKKVIGVVSGKGGVGKSSVTSMLAVLMNRLGYKTAVLDADITGPSIPKAFGLTQKAEASEEFLFPVITKSGIEVMSINLLLEDDTTPVVWRGPVLAGAVKQFWTDVNWGEVDYMFVDMPPGTGDVSLTVFQNLPVDGIIIVTTPQDLVTMIVKKAYNMAKLMNIPVLGLVENMSYTVCPDCGKKINVFGESKIEEVAKELDVPVLARIPIDPKNAALVDKGAVELVDDDYVAQAADFLAKMN